MSRCCLSFSSFLVLASAWRAVGLAEAVFFAGRTGFRTFFAASSLPALLSGATEPALRAVGLMTFAGDGFPGAFPVTDFDAALPTAEPFLAAGFDFAPTLVAPPGTRADVLRAPALEAAGLPGTDLAAVPADPLAVVAFLLAPVALSPLAVVFFAAFLGVVLVAIGAGLGLVGDEATVNTRNIQAR